MNEDPQANDRADNCDVVYLYYGAVVFVDIWDGGCIAPTDYSGG